MCDKSAEMLFFFSSTILPPAFNSYKYIKKKKRGKFGTMTLSISYSNYFLIKKKKKFLPKGKLLVIIISHRDESQNGKLDHR